MGKNKTLRLLGLDLGIALANIIIFSPGLVGIQLGGPSVLATAFGSSILFISIVLFIYGNYKLLVGKEKIVPTHEMRSPDDYVNALRMHKDKKTFGETIDLLIEQIERIQKKKETISEVLLQKFSATEISYQKFLAVVTEVEKIFYMNIISIINKLNAFDEEDYLFVTRNKSAKSFSEEFKKEKLGVYNEYISFVNNATELNEQILLKLDKLLLEISKLNTLECNEIENMPEIEEINNLIKQAKYYK